MSPSKRDIAAPPDTSVLSRGARLLDVFDQDHRKVTLATLVERTGLPRSTTHRVAQKLVELGWLEHRGGYYWVGSRLFEIGSLAPSRHDLRDTVLPYLQDLHEATRLTVQLGILDGTSVVLIERITGHRDVKLLNRVGSRIPAYASSLGRAILAYSSPEVVDRVLASDMPARTSHTLTASDAVRRELVAVPERGWAVDREEGIIGVCCVGAPIFLASGDVVGAISVTGPSQTVRPDRVGPALRTCAAAATRALQRGQPFSLDSGQ